MAKKEKVTWFIDLLSDEEVKSLYKHFSGVTQVKFRDREDAEQRLLNICYGKFRPTLIEALKTVGIPKETVDQFSERLRGPIAFPQGQMKAEDLKKHAKVLGSGEKKATAKDITLSVLHAMQKAIPEDAKGEDRNISSGVIAETLNTNVNAVCRAADQLVKDELIEIEDDSPDDDNRFYWMRLLPAGRKLEVKQPTARLPQSNPGPRAGFSNKYIFRLTATNPRREGTFGWKSWNVIKDGMTFEEYKKAGGRNSDLAWDIDKGFTELRDDPNAKGSSPAVAEASAKKKAKAVPVKTRGTINRKGKPMLPPGKRRTKTPAERKQQKESIKVAKTEKKALAKAAKGGR